jgi:diguanylate cyclase (GGDEF)-like protein/PAS domain S-box-containing protein
VVVPVKATGSVELLGLSIRSAFEYAPTGIAVLSPAGVVITCNPALGELLGRTPASLEGTTLFSVAHPDDRQAVQHNCHSQTSSQRILRHQCRFVRADGRAIWVLVSTAAVPEAPGRPAHLITHVEDIDARKALEAELLHRAQHDPLTGLANRALLAQRIDDALIRQVRPSCLLFVDLDGFKCVNDRYGHAVGDQLLQQLAQRLTALLRPQDVCARLGGDEFVVLCVDTQPHQAEAIAERLRAAVAEPFAIEGLAITVTAAIGVSASDVTTAIDPAHLLRQADARMYEAKRRRAT